MCDYLIIKSKIRPYLKYYLLTHKEIPKHLVNIIDQTPPITLENTLELPLENFKIHGRTEQTQLQGYNLFDYTQVNNLAFGTKQDVSGTYILQNKNYRGYYIQVDPNVTYIISRKSTTDFSRFRVCCTEVLPTANVPVISGSIVNGDVLTDLSITIPENGHYLFLYLSNSNEDITSEMEVQITKSEELLPYEPYVGGTASPSPEFPQPIENVEGNVTIKVANGNDSSEQGYQEQVITFPLAEGQKLMEGDYLADDGVHHVRTKYSITGNETIAKAATTQNPLGFYYTLVIPKNAKYVDSTIYAHLLCNYFKGVQNKIDQLNSGKMTISSSENKVAFNINETYTTVQQVAEFFRELYENDTPVEIEYDLKNETIDPYTEAQQEAYNKIKNLHGYNNITIVNTTSSSLTPNLSFDYYAKGR